MARQGSTANLFSYHPDNDQQQTHLTALNPHSLSNAFSKSKNLKRNFLTLSPYTSCEIALLQILHLLYAYLIYNQTAYHLFVPVVKFCNQENSFYHLHTMFQQFNSSVSTTNQTITLSL